MMEEQIVEELSEREHHFRIIPDEVFENENLLWTEKALFIPHGGTGPLLKYLQAGQVRT